jgi:oxygen-dependent protoporphyrinogen oxidase
VLLRAFLGGRRDRTILDSSDADLEALSLLELERVLGPLGAPMFSQVVRWADRTPQIELGHASRIAAFERALEDVPGLFVLGSGLRGVGSDDWRGPRLQIESARTSDGASREGIGRW